MNPNELVSHVINLETYEPLYVWATAFTPSQTHNVNRVAKTNMLPKKMMVEVKHKYDFAVLKLRADGTLITPRQKVDFRLYHYFFTEEEALEGYEQQLREGHKAMVEHGTKYMNGVNKTTEKSFASLAKYKRKMS